MSVRGQPLKLTPDVQKAVCDALAAGVDRRHACLAAGVTDRTLQNWLRRGRSGEGGKPPQEPFLSLLSAVQKAEAAAVAKHVKNITAAADAGTWTASAWWLERRHPDLYGSDRKRVKELERLVVQLEAAILGKRRAKR